MAHDLGLASGGRWPRDSGNGAHLLARVDLPNDAQSIPWHDCVSLSSDYVSLSGQ